MKKPLLFALNPAQSLLESVLAQGSIELGACEFRHFPDGESYVRVISECKGRDTVILCGLTPPDRWILPLLFLAGTLRELGARSVGLVAPYLPYMRQDKRFRGGEAVSARLFADILAAPVDWLVTVDPHLHRIHALEEIYGMPCRVVSAAPLLAAWIRRHVQRPLVVGPDAESEQWVVAVAEAAEAPFIVLNKVRRGDRDVQVSGAGIERWHGHTPVLVDDLLTTGHTMLEAAALVRSAALGAPVCVAVHGLFVDSALGRLRDAGIETIVTTNSVSHVTNGIDIGGAVLAAMISLQNGHPRGAS